jgi:hypothetical protein
MHLPHPGTASRVEISRCHCSCFFLVELEFVLTKQALYHLNHTSSPFCSGYFGDGGESLEMAGLALNIDFLISVSQVARITGVSHWHPLHLHFFFLKIWWS